MNGNFFCQQCGAPNSAGARFCNKCGAAAPLTTGQAQVPPAMPASVAANQYSQAAPFAGGAIAGTRYGGFWIRFVAAIIDGIIVQVVVMPLSFMVGGVTGFAGAMGGVSHSGLPILGGLIGGMIGFVGSWLYEAIMESSVRQATLGKMIFGMKVTDLYGNRISFGRATGRYFAKIISALTLCIGYIVAGFTERKQALHDMLAGTLVRIG